MFRETGGGGGNKDNDTSSYPTRIPYVLSATVIFRRRERVGLSLHCTLHCNIANKLLSMSTASVVATSLTLIPLVDQMLVSFHASRSLAACPMIGMFM